MFTYFAYGICIASTIVLPELQPCSCLPDMIVRLGDMTDIPEQSLIYERFFYVTSETSIIVLAYIATFVVQSGREITIYPAPEADERMIRLALIGTVMGVALYQRGLLTLHASAIDIGGSGIAFVGSSGWGKSTLAAALHTRGHSILADDVTAIRFDSGEHLVLPAYPQLKLSAESATILGYSPESLFELHAYAIKRGWQVAERFQNLPLPLQRIYILAEAETTSIEHLTQQQALIEVIRHSNPTRLQQPGGKSHFDQCVRLVQTIPFYRLSRPRDLAQLHDLTDRVETHITEQPSAAI